MKHATALTNIIHTLKDLNMVSFVRIFLFFLLSISYTTTTLAITDGFESGRFESNWSNSGERAWTINSDRKIQGRFSARAFSSKNDRGQNFLQTSTNLKSAGQISFSVRTESQSSLNQFEFYIDGVLRITLTGNNEWRRLRFNIPAGLHSLRFVYNGRSSTRDGKAWIDNILGPQQTFSIFDDISYGKKCSPTTNSVWVGDFQGPDVSLNKNNFQLFINNRRITNFNFTRLGASRRVWAPLVMDYSGSMSNLDILNAENAALEFVRGMDTNDLTQVIKFGSSAKRVSPFSQNKNNLSNSITSDSPVGGLTAFYDGLFLGIADLRGRSGDRVIIAYTDGFENSSSVDIDDVINAARSNNIKIYTIGLGNFVDEDDLSRIAEDTGGEFFKAPSSSELLAIYNGIRSEFGGIYRITTTDPQSTKKNAVVKIRVRRNNNTVSEATFTGSGCITSLAPIHLLLEE